MQRCQTSDLCCPFCARCSSRPNFSTGGWRPLAQKVAGHRLRLFDMRRGWGKAIHPPPWQRATLATYRARGGQVAPFDGRDHTGPRSSKQTDKSPSHAREKLLNRFIACPLELKRPHGTRVESPLQACPSKAQRTLLARLLAPQLAVLQGDCRPGGRFIGTRGPILVLVHI